MSGGNHTITHARHSCQSNLHNIHLRWYVQPLFQQWGNWGGEVPGWWVDVPTLFTPLCHAVLISLLEGCLEDEGQQPSWNSHLPQLHPQPGITVPKGLAQEPWPDAHHWLNPELYSLTLVGSPGLIFSGKLLLAQCLLTCVGWRLHIVRSGQQKQLIQWGWNKMDSD